MQVENFLSSCMLKSVFILSSYLNDSSSGQRILPPVDISPFLSSFILVQRLIAILKIIVFSYLLCLLFLMFREDKPNKHHPLQIFALTKHFYLAIHEIGSLIYFSPAKVI